MRLLRQFLVCIVCAGLLAVTSQVSDGRQLRRALGRPGSQPKQNLPAETITISWARSHREQLFEIVKRLVKNDAQAIAAIEENLKDKRVTEQIDYLTDFVQKAVERQ